MNKIYLSTSITYNLKRLVLACLIFSFGCKSDNPKPPTSNKVDPSQLQIPRFNRDSAYAFIQKQVDFGPRNPGSEGHQACEEWLIAKLESFGTTVSPQYFEMEAPIGGKFESTNIFAQINPSSTNRILFGVHWDTRPIADSRLSTEKQDEPILGADDGASGVGVLLEIARLIAKDTSLDLGIDIILFDIEDSGDPGGGGFALGSEYWAKNLPYTGVKPRYGILLDMVGSKNARFAKELYSVQFAPDLVEKVWRLAGFMGYNNYFVDQRGGQISDDHVPVNTIAKIPMIDIINQTPAHSTGFGAYWHTHDDNMDIIDKATLRAVGNVLLQVIYREDAAIF